MNTSFSKSGGPVLDEATFQKLLAAAYVLQEHHDRTQTTAPPETKTENPDADSDTSILAQIVETQHEIQSSHLDLASTAKLVAERILKITGAQGAAVGIVDEEKVMYRAGSGILARQVGQSFRPEATLSASTLLHDVILRCPDASTDFRVNPEITERLGIGSLIAVPVFHNGKTEGALELVYAKSDAFHDQDVRTCQLMAGLVTETLTRTAEEDWRKGLAAERASMLEVLEKIKPQLARLANTPEAALALSKAAPELTETTLDEAKCQHCGSDMAPGEAFCGSCGVSRSSTSRNDLQSKWATLWNLKKETDAEPLPSSPNGSDSMQRDRDPTVWSGLATQEFTAPEKLDEAEPQTARVEASGPDEALQSAAPLVSPSPKDEAMVAPKDAPEEADATLAKAPAEARVWLRSIAVSPPAVQLRGFWRKSAVFVRKHRGDLALAGSFVLFLITILWAVSSDHPTTSADSGNQASTAATALAKPKRKQAPPQPKLSMFEEFLVSVGLAEPPPAPSYSGNPNIPVWVDVHTALYYCPGSDLYGKTPQGKIASQHDAQVDQFEPASRKVCD
ncbi:MAG: GAF domain-containing protein [Terriglobales bacterium]